MSVDSMLDSAQRRIHLYTRLGVDRLQLIEIKGREHISRPYRFRLKLRTDALDIVSLEDLVGTAARASFQLPDPHWMTVLESDSLPRTRDFCGILSHVSLDHTDDRYRYYQATLRPKLWTLGLNRRFRMFSQLTTREIVTQVLGDLPVRWVLAADRSHNYCVQYGESDLAFASRLLEEDGLFYFFEHQYESNPEDDEQHAERLVVTDSIDSVASDTLPIYNLDEIDGGVRDSMRIRRWSEHRALTPSKVVSLDRSFQSPNSLIRGDDAVAGSDGTDARTVTAYPSGVARRGDDVSPAGSDRDQLAAVRASAETDAIIRTQRIACIEACYKGGGDVATMMPGESFAVSRDSIPDPSSYYVTEVEHLVRLRPSTHSGPDTDPLLYKNRFLCHANSVPYRPSRSTPKPHIDGVVSARVVVDPSITDDEVCVDKYGRVKVVFPWQESADEPSCWIRVSQFWAGPRWGAFFWPREGHEVLVAFEHGDPDRPVIVGSVYNANNMPPLPLPNHKLSCGIHSCSHKGNPIENTNCVVFHDSRNEEYLQLHSETYQCLSSETKNLKWSSGEEIEFMGHHWLFDAIGGSGGGGSDLTGNDTGADAVFKKPDDSDDFSVGEMFRDLFLTSDRGSIGYTVGDSFSKQFGRNYETYFGCNIWLGCDPVDFFEFLVDKMGGPYGFLLPLLIGAGGQGTTLFGGSHDLKYGVAVSSMRGPSYENKTTRLGDETDGGNALPIDKPAALVVEITISLCLIMDFAGMLLTKAAVSNEGDSWKGYVRFNEIWTLWILPRLQGLIEFTEGTVAKLKTLTATGQSSVETSNDAVIRALRALVTTDAAAGDSVDAAKSEIEIAIDDLATALKKLARVVLD